MGFGLHIDIFQSDYLVENIIVSLTAVVSKIKLDTYSVNTRVVKSFYLGKNECVYAESDKISPI